LPTRLSASTGMFGADVTDSVSHVSPTERLREVHVKHAERELFFWTVRQALKLVLLAAIVIDVVLALAEGRVPLVNLIGVVVLSSP
jgi:hypothetical protein